MPGRRGAVVVDVVVVADDDVACARAAAMPMTLLSRLDARGSTLGWWRRR